MTDYRLTINNPEIFQFYEKHSLDFEKLNIALYHLVKGIIETNENNRDTVDHSIATLLLKKMTSLEESIERQQREVQTHLSDKLNEYRRDYMNDVKLLLLSNNVEQITPLIKETTDNLLNRTTLVLNDMLPKTDHLLAKEISNHFDHLQTFLSRETAKLSNASFNEKTMDEFLHNSTQMVSQSLNTITNIIHTNNTRLENNLSANNHKVEEMKQLIHQHHTANHSLQTSMNEILKKFEKGVGKGNISEHILYNIVLSNYPCAQVEHVGNEQKETGDIVLIRNNRPKILIENKDHTSCNVPKQDVEKFIRDCEIQNCSGIMLAQNRGIANKENFEIQIHNGNVLLYVHHVHFDPEKIKTAIELVEQMKLKLDELKQCYGENRLTIDASLMNDINKEFNAYISQKNGLLKLLKDFTDKMNVSIQELKFPNLEQFLSKHYANATNQNENICKYCEKYVPKSMQQHYRYCTAKRQYDMGGSLDVIQIETETTHSKR